MSNLGRGTIALMLGLPLAASAQGPTLRELAIEHKGQVSVSSIACGWMDPLLPLLVKRADLILEGTVVSRRTYATSDERDILTDYQVAPMRVIVQRFMIAGSRPGVAPAFIFKTRGGTVTFDGYPISVDVEVNSRRVELREGDHVIVFGAYDRSDGKWSCSPWDVFYLSKGVVTTKPGLEHIIPSMALASFIQTVVALSATR